MSDTGHREYVVVSVGGSLIVPDGISTEFLSSLRAFVLARIEQGYSFAIIAGGGRTARRYQEAVRSVVEIGAEDIDWIGIHATRLNAQLLKIVFKDIASVRVVKDPTETLDRYAPVIIAAGWKPGCSTDYDAVLLAKQLGAKKLVNLSNIDYAYDSDPKTNPDAKKLEKISWAEFRKLIPETWDPGLSSPFDPIASKEAEASGIEVAILNGAKLEEFGKYLDGEAFVGTTIS